MKTCITTSWQQTGGPSSLAKNAFLRLLLVSALCCLTSTAEATTRIWTGTGGNKFWSTPGNWNPVGAPQNGEVLRIEAESVSTNDLVNLRLDAIWCFARFEIRGNGFTVTNGINANLNSILSVTVPITLAKNQEFISVNYPGANMTLGGGLNLNGFDLTLKLAARGGGIFVTNVISGVGNIRVVRNYDQVPNVCAAGLGAPGINNTFTGTVTLDSGILHLRGSEPFGTGGIIFNAGSLSLYDASSARPLVFGSNLRITTSGLCQWSGPISLPTGEYPLAYLESSNRLVLSGPISGPTNCSLVFDGSEVEISGSAIDTFTGRVVASCELLLLNKSGGTHIGARQLDISSGSEVRWLAHNQVAGADVFLLAGSGLGSALANLNVFSDTFGAITSAGGSIETTAGQLTVSGPVTQLGAPYQVAPTFISGNLYLPSGFRVFDVQYSSTLFNNLVIAANIHGPGSLQKTGGGTLWLSGASDYTGLTHVNEGTLVAGANGALGAASAGTTVQDGATLALKAIGGILAEPIYLRGDGVGGTNGALNVDTTLTVTLRHQFPSIYACLDLTTNATIRVETSGRLTADGFVSGIGPLTKIGPGSLVFSNANPNTYVGETRIREGTLELRKPTSTLAVPGDLMIGPATVGSPAAARWFQTGGLNASATVTVNAHALLDLNGNNQNLNRLNLYDGGDAQTGAGTLTFLSGGPVTVGSSNLLGSQASSSFSGRIGLPANGTIFFAVAPYAPGTIGVTAPELDVSALIPFPVENVNFERAGIYKSGGGELRLTGNNTFNGRVDVVAGTLTVGSATALGTTFDSTFVENGASLAIINGITINNESLRLNSTNPAALDNRGGNNTWTGPITLARNSGISVNQDWALTIYGAISGSGALTKVGAGTLWLVGGGNNTHAGNTFVNEGLLALGKTYGFQAVPASLVIGPTGGGPAALVRYYNHDQVWQNITINSSGLLDLNGWDEYAGDLTLNGGGDVQTGTGSLYVLGANGIAVNPANNNPATISGKLGFDNGSRTINVGSGTTTPGAHDLDISATIFQANPTVHLNKTGPGRARLGGNNTYTGTTTVSGGQLQIDGPQPQSPVQVFGARLQGSGTVGHITFGGNAAQRLAPGASPGMLTTSNFNANALGGGQVEIELNGLSLGSGYDQINVRGTVNLTGLTLSPTLNFASAATDQFTIINNDGADAVIGTFAGLPQHKKLYVGQELFQINYAGGTGNDVVLNRLVTPPPPTLTIERIPPASVRLIWATNDPAFRLQSHTNLITTHWISATPQPTVIGTNNVVTNSISVAQKFYRLVNP